MDFFSQCDLWVTYKEELLNGKLHFLYSQGCRISNNKGLLIGQKPLSQLFMVNFGQAFIHQDNYYTRIICYISQLLIKKKTKSLFWYLNC